MDAERKDFRRAALAGGLVIVLAALIFLAGPSSGMITVLSSVLPLGLSFIGSVMGYMIFRRQGKDRAGKQIWGAMTFGLTCWTAGEAIWLFYELAGGSEIPYPSLADVLWVIGYIPLIYSIGHQYHSFRAGLPLRTRMAMAGLLTVLGLTIIATVVLPILADPESGTAVEMFFNLAYPVCDIILLSFALALVAVFFGGQLALSWAVIAAGILLDALADLLFVYGAWNGLYYPDGRVNLLSAAFDVLYMAAYVVWVIGLFLRLRLPDPGKDVDLQKFIPESGKDFILVADNRGRVVYLDPALASILGMRDSAAGIGKTFGQLFGLPRAYEEAAIRKAAKTGLSDDYTVSLGLSRSKYRLRAVASSDPQQFPGYDILLHPDTKRPLPDRDDLLLGQVADRARTADRTRRFSSEEDPLRVYFNTLVDLLFILVSRAGGAGVGTAFEADVNDTARKAGCRFELRSGRAIWNEDGTASGIYRDLLEEAVRYANQVISASTIGRKLEEIERFMDPAVVREADEHRLRRARWPKDVAG